MDDIQPLFSGVSEAKMESFYRDQLKVFEPSINRWTEADDFRIDDPAELLGIFRLLSFTIVAKERFQDTDASLNGFDAAHKTLIETIADGLFID